MRRDLALAAGLFDETLHYWGDYEFVLRALRADERAVGILDQPLVGHRDHEANASRNDVDMRIESIRVATPHTICVVGPGFATAACTSVF
jgi:GT2 family glycosyltransferase